MPNPAPPRPALPSLASPCQACHEIAPPCQARPSLAGASLACHEGARTEARAPCANYAARSVSARFTNRNAPNPSPGLFFESCRPSPMPTCSPTRAMRLATSVGVN